MSRRGEVTTIVIVGIALAGLIIGGLLPNPVRWLQGEARPNTESKTYDTKDVVITPFIAVDDKGKTTVAYKTENRSAKGGETRVMKLTWGQRIAGFFAGLGSWTILFLGILLVAIMIAPAAVFARLRHVWKEAFKNTVAGVREIEDKEVYEKVTKSIATKQNTRDKRLVDRVKMELH